MADNFVIIGSGDTMEEAAANQQKSLRNFIWV